MAEISRADNTPTVVESSSSRAAQAMRFSIRLLAATVHFPIIVWFRTWLETFTGPLSQAEISPAHFSADRDVEPSLRSIVQAILLSCTDSQEGRMEVAQVV